MKLPLVASKNSSSPISCSLELEVKFRDVGAFFQVSTLNFSFFLVPSIGGNKWKVVILDAPTLSKKIISKFAKSIILHRMCIGSKICQVSTLVVIPSFNVNHKLYQ